MNERGFVFVLIMHLLNTSIFDFDKLQLIDIFFQCLFSFHIRGSKLLYFSSKFPFFPSKIVDRCEHKFYYILWSTVFGVTIFFVCFIVTAWGLLRFLINGRAMFCLAIYFNFMYMIEYIKKKHKLINQIKININKQINLFLEPFMLILWFL